MDNKTKFILICIGAALLILGVIFLLINLGSLLTTYWWTLIVLTIAGIGLFYSWNSWKKAGNFTSPNVAVPGGISLILLVVFVIAFIMVGWRLIWPALIAVAGLAVIMLATANKPNDIVGIVKDQLDDSKVIDATDSNTQK